MPWSRSSPTRWTRPLSGMEGYFNFVGGVSAALCDDRQHYTLLSKVRVELDVPDWRYQQPQIAATVENMELIYEVANETRVAKWVEETFVVSSASDADELRRSVQLIKQAMLYYIPASSELVLRVHHTIIEGTGIKLFWHSYFNALVAPLAQITFGDEHLRLPPVLEEVLGNSEQPTPQQADRTAELLGPVAESMPGIGPVSKLGKAPSGCFHNKKIRCKDRSFSVTSAVHAAYIQTITKYADPTANVSRYVTMNSLSLRPYLAKPHNTSDYGVSLYYAPLPFVLDTPTSFSEAATALHEHYQTGFKNNTENRDICGYVTCMLRDMVQTPEFQAKPISRDALVSSLGIVEEHLKHTYGTTVTVEDFMFGAETVLGMSMLFIYTFRDQLRLVYSFNDGFEEGSDILMYLEEVDKVMTEELLG
ncbi:hypothetical protein BDV27DRAFT_148731 [Aspergillus caelatus]|uniref:Condensation domain-containing protein n=1 Tax=Aspergillus caelatus TaxID=61420 RepID=A0A5N6ZRY8_9EURO|nr:uncharacterized protein BDV27DRAFT_148731 [Aspergillus caelatus]KAE8360397.1 hypothetical protein BDV27DRAFT_148731 [Aspergillus caelatus]